MSALSGGESNGAIFELLIAKMQAYAEYTPLILFIEAAEISFDKAFDRALFEFFKLKRDCISDCGHVFVANNSEDKHWSFAFCLGGGE